MEKESGGGVNNINEFQKHTSKATTALFEIISRMIIPATAFPSQVWNSSHLNNSLPRGMNFEVFRKENIFLVEAVYFVKTFSPSLLPYIPLFPILIFVSLFKAKKIQSNYLLTFYLRKKNVSTSFYSTKSKI